jgi:putative phosphoribosyl transferase
VFAHGTGAGRQSPGCRAVAADLAGAGLATLTLDLLTEAERESRDPPFDVKLQADRLADVTGWLVAEPELAGLPVGLFATGPAGAAALLTAARHPDRIASVVSCGGRPDLVWDDLPAVHAPALLVVGAEDERALGWNRDALCRLPYPKDLAVVPGANDLDAESSPRAQVADLARDWFARHLRTGATAVAGR